MRRRASGAAGAAALLLFAGPALAGPSGEVIIEGDADFSRPDDHTTIIDTKTDHTVLEWEGGFDILPGELVKIDQPSEDSKTFNHIDNSDPTKIGGKLESNGWVYIVNPSGLFLGDSAVIDVGGLVAAAGRLSYDDFLDDVDRFTDLGGEVVVAEGAQVRADQSVALLGRRVANYGTVVAEGGMIAFVAGEEAVLASLDGHVNVRVDGGGGEPLPGDEFALVQAGTVDAGSGRVQLSAGDTWSLAMNHTGVTRGREIRLEADAGLVQVAGTLDASATGAGETGGRIEVLGEKVAVLDARLDASGDAGGGAIRVGGDVLGGGTLPTAARTVVTSEAELVADAITSGDGGSIVVFAEERAGFYGRASAQGGAESGDGGFIEISGREYLEARGHEIALSAPNGRSGTLLYDPDRIQIVGGSGPGPDGDGDDFDLADPDAPGQLQNSQLGRILDGDDRFDPPGSGIPVDPFLVYESEIESTDANIILQANEQIFVGGVFDHIVGSEAVGEIVVMDGNSLVIQTTGDAPDGELAIDLGADLTWKVSGGGLIDIRTLAGDLELDDPATGPRGDIRVGHLVFGGREFQVDENGVSIPLSVVADSELEPFGLLASQFVSPGVNLETQVGSVTLGSIRAEGSDAADGGLVRASSGADVRIATQAGDITVLGDAGGVGILTSGGSAGFDPGSEAPDSGGFGGNVTLFAGRGNVSVEGSVDASGGDGLAGFADFEGSELERFRPGTGGQGGTITLQASRDAMDAAPTGSVTVTADLTSDGGSGEGLVTRPPGLSPLIQESAGGASGIIAFQVDTGVTIQGMPGDALTISASGGQGDRFGGSGSGFSAISIAPPLTPEGTEGDIQVVIEHATLQANGGSATAGGGGGSGGNSGGILIDAGLGEVEAWDGVTIESNGGAGFAALFPEGDGARDGGGGDALVVSISGDAGVRVGDIVATGGAGEGALTSPLGGVPGRTGGDGGSVSLVSTGGDLEVANITLDGGAATPVLPDEAASGGRGGSATLQTGETVSEIPVAGGDVIVGGTIQSLGGAGVDEEGDPTVAEGGILSLRSNSSIASGGGSVQGGQVNLTAPVIGAPGDPIDIAGTEAEDDAALLTLQASDDFDETLHVNLLPMHAGGAPGSGLERVEVVHEDEQSTSTLLRDDLTTILQVDGAAAEGGDAVLALMGAMDDGDPVLAFRLDAIADDAGDPLDAPAIEIPLGAVNLGSAGGSITNDDGRILGEAGGGGSAVHLASTGNLLLEGAGIGEEGTPLRASGGPDASLAISARGDVHVDAIDVAAGGAFGAIDVSQGIATAETTILGRNAADALLETILDVDDTTADSLAPTATLHADTRISGTNLAYRQQTLASGGGEAPLLSVSQVTLGGNGLLSITGDLELADETAPSIELSGEGADLLLDAGGDLLVADLVPGQAHLVMTESADPDADTADLVITVAGAVGGGASGPLRTENVQRLAAQYGGETFRLYNQAGGGAGLEIAQIEFPAPVDLSGETLQATVTGIRGGSLGASADLELDNEDRPIVLGDVPTASPTSAPIHVSISGDASFLSRVLVDNAQFVEVEGDDGETELVAVNLAAIDVDGDVLFDGTIDTGVAMAVDDITDPMDGPEPDEFVEGSLVVRAGGQATYQDHVGDSSPLRFFSTTDAVMAGGARTVRAGDIVFFGTVDGPADLSLEGVPTALAADDTESRIAFGGNVGQGSALGGLDAQADHIAFSVEGGGSAEQVIATGDIDLGTGQADVPPVATISDAQGNLRFQTGGDFTIAPLDKLSAVGSLQIAAAGTVTVGDLSAPRIEIQSPDIQVTARDPARLQLPDGSLSEDVDGGVDWVANAVVTSSAPQIVGPPGEMLDLYIGSGGVSIPGGLSAYRIRYARPSLDAITSADLVGEDGTVLDLTGDGPTLVGDPVRALPRPERTALPALPPRFGSDLPAARARVNDRQVLAFLRCSGFGPAAADACGPEEGAVLAGLELLGDSALDTARAREITKRYRELLATPGAVAALRSAFASAGRAYGESLEWRDGGLDGAAFYRFLASAPRSQAEALASMRELAWLFAELELLGLADADTRRLQHTLAQEFAGAAGLEGLDADAVRAAVDASPIGLP